MQEYSLVAQIPIESHAQVLQQCAGVCRMQPQTVEKLHLIFKARPPPGLAEIQKSSGGGSQGVVPPEVQKTRTMLSTGLYYIQLVGTTQEHSGHGEENDANGHTWDSGDVIMSNGDVGDMKKSNKLSWVLEFRDTPDPGKQPVSSRLLYRIPILDGDIVKFTKDFGFEYVTRYVVIEQKFYDQNVSLSLKWILRVSNREGQYNSTNANIMPKNKDLVPLSESKTVILTATIETTDGSNAELRERAVRELLMKKETMKGAVDLLPGDRLTLDTIVAPVVGQRA